MQPPGVMCSLFWISQDGHADGEMEDPIGYYVCGERKFHGNEFSEKMFPSHQKKKKKVVARHDVPMHSFMEGFFIILDNGWTCQTPRMASCYPTVHSYVLCR